MLESTKNLSYKKDGFLVIYNALLLNILLESNSVNAFHYDILNPVAVADIINLYDIRMRKNSDSL